MCREAYMRLGDGSEGKSVGHQVKDPTWQLVPVTPAVEVEEGRLWDLTGLTERASFQ